MYAYTSKNIVSSYRYGFQGQEKDNEMYGSEGTSLNYKYRMHDPRLGRFFAVDPLAAKYPFYSTYAFSGNRLIDAFEFEGLEPIVNCNYKILGYKVQKNQGITQLVEDFNQIYKGIHQLDWQQVVQYNYENHPESDRIFKGVTDIKDINDKGWSVMNMNEGDELYFDDEWFGYDKWNISYFTEPSGEDASTYESSAPFEAISFSLGYSGSFGNTKNSLEVGAYSNSETKGGLYHQNSFATSLIGANKPSAKLTFNIGFHQSAFEEGETTKSSTSLNTSFSSPMFGFSLSLSSGTFKISIGPQSPGFKMDVSSSVKSTVTTGEAEMEGFGEY